MSWNGKQSGSASRRSRCAAITSSPTSSERSAHVADQVIFFGGTALSRTYLVAARLSEDIDLIARGSRAEVVAEVRQALRQGLLRSHGRIVWEPDFSANDIEAAVLITADGIRIRLQLLKNLGYESWPVQLTVIEQRYSDAPSARLYVPTVESFVALKTMSWFDRRAARDLYDLWALAEAGHFTVKAAETFARYGPTQATPKSYMFDKPPADTEWRAQLASQTRLTVTARQAAEVVRSAWVSTLGVRWS